MPGCFKGIQKEVIELFGSFNGVQCYSQVSAMTDSKSPAVKLPINQVKSLYLYLFSHLFLYTSSQLKYVFRLEEDVSRAVAHNSLTP